MAQLAVVASASSSNRTGNDSSLAFDAAVGTVSYWWSDGYAPAWLRADLGSGGAAAAEWYSVAPYPGDTIPPTGWTFEGSNDATSWTVLDTRTGISFPNGSENRTFTFTNATAYRYYRLNLSAPTSGAGLGLAVSELRIGTGRPDSWMWADRGDNITVLSGDYTIGVVFVPQVDGYVTHFTGYRTSDTNTATFYLYNTAGSSLASKTISQATMPGSHWYRLALTTPVAVTAGTPYMVTVHCPSNSGYISGGITSDIVSGDVKIPANGTVTFNGSTQNPRYGNGNVYPTLAAGSKHLVGVQFQPTATATGSGSASGAFTWVGAATGKRTPKASASGAFTWSGAAVGKRAATGVATGAFTWAGAAVGAAPAVGVKQGSASGAFTWSGVAVGRTTMRGAATGTFGWVGAATSGAPGLPGVLYVSSPSPRYSTIALGDGGETWDGDLLRVSSRSERHSAVTLILTPAPVPLVINEWPVMRQAHVMPALSAATPRMRPHVDYTVETAEVGRDHVFIDGVDVTFLRNSPTMIGETVESSPLGDDRASIEFPQIKPWDIPGTGDLSMLREDAPVEVALIRPDGSRVHRFDGFVSSFSDYSGDGRETYTVQCEGVLAQAMHEPWEPPLFLDETDIGILIPRALNAVPGRRYRKIPETITGFTSRDRGSQDYSVWQQVQNWLAPAWTVDGRQLMLKRKAHGVYRLELKAATTTVHWTVTKGAPGVAVDLLHDSSTRRDSVYGRGVAPDGGTWANWFFPFLDAFVPPPYPMAGFANMSVGTTDAMTTTGRGVSDWQRRMRDLGYPVTVDGVMNSADTRWVLRVQADRGLTRDGSLGPQTWNGTFDPGPTEVDLRAVRRPMATKPEVEEYLYAANGARTGNNPAYDGRIIRHAMPGVNFGTGIRKSEAFAPSASILAREGTTGAAGRITLKTDPHEADSSRLFIRAGDNIKVIGHRGETVVQVADVSHGQLETSLTVDERARDAMTVEAVLERNREARKSVANRSAKVRASDLDRADVVLYESESKAGVLPRFAVNGNSGLWSVVPMFVSQVGVAKVELHATTPKAEIVCALFSRPVKPNLLEALLPNPLASSDGWYDNVERLKSKHGLMEVFGDPDNPGGYWPRQKGKGPLTGDMLDTSGTLYDSGYGGVVWVALYTSRSTWVHGRIFPAVPQ